MKTFYALMIMGSGAFISCQRPRTIEQPLATEKNALGMDSLEFPRVIDNGKRIVYQFSKMTPRGLRFFLDTVENSGSVLVLDSLNARYLFPIGLTTNERNSAPGILAISLPGDYEETVFGMIDENDQLRINYKSQERSLSSPDPILFRSGAWSAIFQEGRLLQVRITCQLRKTAAGDHLAGKGQMKIFENDFMMQQTEIVMVCNPSIKR
jgi:hypothetical protein